MLEMLIKQVRIIDLVCFLNFVLNVLKSLLCHVILSAQILVQVNTSFSLLFSSAAVSISSPPGTG